MRDMYERSEGCAAGSTDPIRFHGRAPQRNRSGASRVWGQGQLEPGHGPGRPTLADCPPLAMLVRFMPIRSTLSPRAQSLVLRASAAHPQKFSCFVAWLPSFFTIRVKKLEVP